MARKRRWLVPRDVIEEQRLIDAAKLDPRRFAELYENNFERVYAYVVTRVRDCGEAQDVTTEVFYQALKHLKDFEWRGTPFAAWLYRIAANEIADRAKRGAQTQTTDLLERTAEETFDRDLDAVEERARLFRLVGELPEDQQAVVRMRFVEERPIREIANALGRSEGAVKQLQFRALRNLRDRLGAKNG